MENMNEKDYKEERFEFTLYINDNIICKRNFKIFNFVEGSMETIDFKNCIDSIVKLIDDDLKSKSRVYTWYTYNPDEEDPNDEFHQPLIEPWECTFKIVVTDNKRVVIEKIWDGYGYPKFIRKKVDLSNKTVEVTNENGTTFNYPKDSFFEYRKGRLTYEQQLLKSMIMDKQDVLFKITRRICEACSPSKEEMKENGRVCYATNKLYLSNYENKVKGDGKEYDLSMAEARKKMEDEWGKAVAKKTREYFKNLY